MEAKVKVFARISHLVAKQAVDEVDLISRLTWFGGDPEIEVADSCIQLLFK